MNDTNHAFFLMKRNATAVS